MLTDPIILLLAGLWLLSLSLFLSGVLPYPFGTLILLLFLLARLSYLRSKRG